MGILDKLTQQGSNLTAYNGVTPNKYDKETALNPIKQNNSDLDLDGLKPKNTYRDTAPEGQGGKA